eukprot:GHRR01009548.1.p2 GENE.GHRR01009548.1~~GHRR01009548.1.p2  ORF type:complete len:112 (+),score=18.77 GHRR01009548.1:646-981(+)
MHLRQQCKQKCQKTVHATRQQGLKTHISTQLPQLGSWGPTALLNSAYPFAFYKVALAPNTHELAVLSLQLRSASLFQSLIAVAECAGIASAAKRCPFDWLSKHNQAEVLAF